MTNPAVEMNRPVNSTGFGVKRSTRREAVAEPPMRMTLNGM